MEVTITMRVPLSDRTYRRLKAAASLRGVGQGQLAAQIIDERVAEFMNFDGVDEKFPTVGNLPGGEDV